MKTILATRIDYVGAKGKGEDIFENVIPVKNEEGRSRKVEDWGAHII